MRACVNYEYDMYGYSNIYVWCAHMWCATCASMASLSQSSGASRSRAAASRARSAVALRMSALDTSHQLSGDVIRSRYLPARLLLAATYAAHTLHAIFTYFTQKPILHGSKYDECLH